jgi:hypothetical protein
MCSYQHLHAIGVAIKEDPGLVKRIQADLPGTYYEISERLFPGKFWGGKHPRFSPSGFDFRKVYVEDQINFQVAVGELKELLQFTNTTLERSAVTALRIVYANQTCSNESTDPNGEHQHFLFLKRMELHVSYPILEN